MYSCKLLNQCTAIHTHTTTNLNVDEVFGILNGIDVGIEDGPLCWDACRPITGRTQDLTVSSIHTQSHTNKVIQSYTN